MNIKLNKTNLTVLIPSVLALAAAVLLGLYFLFGGSSEAPSNTNMPELNVAASPTPSSTNQPGGAGARETPKANSGEQVIVKIRGTIKREDNSVSGAPAAIVALYNPDKRGTQPQPADNGRFEFSNVPLRADTTYTLQAKAPGLCAEEPVTLKNADQGVITKDVILKRCQSEPSGTPATKHETTPLTDISTGISELRGSVSSIAATLGSAITFCLVLIVLSLLSVTFMVFRLEKRFADDNPRIDHLYGWKGAVDAALSKLATPPTPAQPVLSLTSELSQTLTNLTQEMKQLIAVLPDLVQPRSEGAPPGFRPDSLETQNERTRQTARATRVSEPLQNAVEWYRGLIMFGQASPPPIYLEINYNRSDRSRVESNPQISFDELPHLGSFVLFCESPNQTRGWVFPNPNTNFAADHSWVFANLNATNFLKELTNLKPKELRLNDGIWQLNL